MPRNRRPAKRYQPRAPRLDAHLHAIDRIATLLDGQRDSLLKPLRSAFEAFRTGHGTPQAWCDLADGMNVAEVLAELSIGSNLLAQFQQAQAALSAVHARRQAGGSWTLRAAEITALDDGTWAAGIQLEHCSQGELQQAISTVKRRTAGALAGSVAPGTIVCVGQLGRDDAVRLVSAATLQVRA
jgi:hypothetical protein